MICWGEFATCQRRGCPYEQSCEVAARMDAEERRQGEFVPMAWEPASGGGGGDDVAEWDEKRFSLEDVRHILWLLFRELDAVEFRIIRAKLLDRQATFETIANALGVSRQAVHKRIKRKATTSNTRLFDIVFAERGAKAWQGKRKGGL
jgi:DNA-binding NtrC family response regulator